MKTDVLNDTPVSDYRTLALTSADTTISAPHTPQSYTHQADHGTTVIDDYDLGGFIDVLQEIKLSLADEESQSTLGALKAHIRTTLMRIPSCADEGKKFRDAKLSDRTVAKDVTVNVQGLCDEVCPSSSLLCVAKHESSLCSSLI